MLRLSHLLALSTTALVLSAAPVIAQSSSGAVHHVVVVKLVERGGSAPYGFEPANVQVDRGDTLRFLQAAEVPHNVRFTKLPGGAKLGGAKTGPYLVSKGQTYDLVIDARFTDGQYAFVCDPHEMLGMRGSMTVVSPATVVGSK